MLLAKGYPDIGWNPCGGERYLDFLRFAVFVNGEAGGGGGPGVGGWGHWPKVPLGGAYILSHGPGLVRGQGMAADSLARTPEVLGAGLHGEGPWAVAPRPPDPA